MPPMKTSIGYIYEYGLQEFEGCCFFTNVTICQGTDMESLINDFKEKNPDLLDKDFSKEKDGGYSYWKMPICFIPVRSEGTHGMVDRGDLIKNPKGVSNPFN